MGDEMMLGEDGDGDLAGDGGGDRGVETGSRSNVTVLLPLPPADGEGGGVRAVALVEIPREMVSSDGGVSLISTVRSRS